MRPQTQASSLRPLDFSRAWSEVQSVNIWVTHLFSWSKYFEGKGKAVTM